MPNRRRVEALLPDAGDYWVVERAMEMRSGRHEQEVAQMCDICSRASPTARRRRPDLVTERVARHRLNHGQGEEARRQQHTPRQPGRSSGKKAAEQSTPEPQEQSRLSSELMVTHARPVYDAAMSVTCDGLLVESANGGECDQGDACQALALRGDYAAYRAAHGRVITAGQSENKDEYGGEA
jgi:hypothetical protein